MKFNLPFFGGEKNKTNLVTLEEKIKKNFPLEYFKKLMIFAGKQKPDKDGDITLMKTHPAMVDVRLMERCFYPSGLPHQPGRIRIICYIDRVHKVKDAELSSLAKSTLKGMVIPMGNSGNIDMHYYNPQLNNPYFTINITCSSSITETYNRMCNVLAHLSPALVQATHPFLSGKVGDFGIHAVDIIDEGDKMPVIQPIIIHKTQGEITQNLEATSAHPGNTQDTSASTISPQVTDDLQNQKNRMRSTINKGKYESIRDLYRENTFSAKPILSQKIDEELGDLIQLFHEKTIKNNKSVKLPRGILLEGPAGTGKTSIAKWLAAETGVLFEISSTDYDSQYISVGETALLKKLETINTFAKDNHTHALIMLDECDKICSKRDEQHKSANSILNVLLKFMDGMKDKDHVTILASTNVKQLLDSAFLSRCDAKYLIDKPTKDEAGKILLQKISNKIATGKVKFEEQFYKPKALDFMITEVLAEKLQGMTGRTINDMIDKVGNNYVKSKTPITMNDIQEVIYEFKKMNE